MFIDQPMTQRTVRVWFESHSLVSWLLLGLIAGWLAGQIGRGKGFGCVTDIILGLIGSYIGGWIFMKLGIFGGGFLYSLAAATLGAVILVSIAHLFGRSDNRDVRNSKLFIIAFPVHGCATSYDTILVCVPELTRH